MAQTIKDYLNSKEFKKAYKCWGYSNKLYDTKGEPIDGDKYELYDDEKWETFISTHEVERVEEGWELGDDHEMYAYAKIIVKGDF